MSNDFDDEFDDEFEDEEEGGPAGETFEEMLRRLAASGNLTTRHVSDDGEEGESREISVEEFNAQMSGVSQIKNDYDDNEDDEDDESSSQQFSIGFGLGSDGSVTRLEDDGSGGLSFSFTLDEDGIEVPEFRCPKCKIKNCEELDLGSDTYKCNACGFEFVPEIYKTLEAASAYVERAEQSWLEGKYSRVIKDSTAALNLDPNIRKAFLQRGKALVEKEKMEQAENDFSEAIRISPDYDVAYFERGRVRMYLQKFDDAIADFTKSIGFDPDFAETYRLRAVAYLQQERYDEAINDLSEALKRDPNEAQSWFERGYNYSLLGEHQKAIQDYSEALSRDSGHRDSYARRAESYEKLERYQDAITDYKSFLRTIGKGTTVDEINERINALQLKLNPNVKLVDSPEAEEESHLIFQRGLERFESEDYEGCIADLDQAIHLAPENAEYYLARFKVKAKLNDASGASEDLTKAYQLDPTDEEIKALVQKLTGGDGKHSQVVRLLMSAQEKMNANDLAGSIEDLKKASELDPDDESVKNILSQIPPALLNGESDLTEDSGISEEDRERANQFVMSGLEKFEGEDYEGCIDDLTQAIDLNPELGIYGLRGLAKFNLGQNEAALLDYSEAIRLEPNNSVGYLGRSLIHLQNESYDQAIADFDSVLDRHLELDENNKYDSYLRRGYAKLQIELFTDAIPDLSQAIMLRPEDPDAYYYRAKAYKELQNYKSAISDFQACIELTDDEEDRNEALGFIQENSASLSSDTSTPSTPNLPPEPKKMELANAHILCAVDLKESRDFAGALKEAQLARYLIPDVKLPYELAFAIYNDMEDWENGISSLLEVLRIAPDDVEAHKNLGALKTKIGDLDGAVADLTKATKLDPKHAQSHLFLGVSYLMQANYPQALEYLTKSINLDPSVPVAYLHRASTKEKLKDYVAAIPDFEKYCALGGSPEVPDLAPLREHITYLKKEFGHMSTADIQLDERKQKLQNEINERDLKLEQLKRETSREIDRLRKERDSLGFLAMGKKKEINQKILSLESQISDFAAKTDALRKQ